MLRTYLLINLCFVVLISCQSNNTDDRSESQKQPNELQVEQKEKTQKPIILFFGNSITAGYGLDMEQAFPNLIQERMDSMGYEYKVINAGLSGETTAGGLNRIDWVLKTVPDIFVLELGANDGLRGLDLDESKSNLNKIIEKVRKVNPTVEIILAGMMVPPNMGGTYASKFQSIFTEVANEKEVTLLPFILANVAGIPYLNQSDGIHPTPEGQEIVAENVWQTLAPLLNKTESL